MVMVGVLTFLLVLVAVALIGLILIQRGKGGGLSGVFGGGGVEQAFGTRAATMAQKATAVLSILFLVICVWLGLIWHKRGPAMEPMPSAPTQQAPASPVPGGN